MTEEQIETILRRPGGITSDPTLKALIEFVEIMTDIAVREATGFYTATLVNVQRDIARAEFVNAMEKAATPQEG